MSKLNETLHTLAINFADAVLEALRSSSLEEIMGGHPINKPKLASAKAAPTKAAPTKTRQKGRTRLPRRSLEQIAGAVDQIVTLLHKHPEGLRAENIRQELNLDAREVPRVLHMGIDTKKLVILSGQRRSTTYGLPGSRKVAKKVEKVVKKAAKVVKITKKAPSKAKTKSHKKKAA